MRKLLIGLLFALPAVAFASPVSWDFSGGNLLQPLQSGWSALVKANRFQATGTTASIFPYASTTALSATTFCLTGDLPCRSTWPTGGGIADPFTHPAAGQSATTSLMLLFGQASTSQLTATSSVYLATLGGNVGIGTDAPTNALDIIGTAIRQANTATDATNKAFKFTDRNYTNAQNDFLIVFGQSKSTGNTLLLGGGQTGYTAASAIGIYTGTGNNTDIGTSRLSIDSTGNITVSSLTGGGVVSSGATGVLYNSATTTASCSGTVSCSSFTVLGSSPITLTGTGASASPYDIATTSTIAISQLAYYTKTSGITTIGGVSTSSATINNGLTGTLTTLGSGQTIGLATINAGVLGAVVNGSVPTSQATSTLYGVGTNGFVLAEVLGIPTWVATTTLSTISGQLDLTTKVTGDLPFANLAQGGANTFLVNQTGATADFAAVASSTIASGLYVGTAGQVLYRTTAGTWVGTATTTAGTGLSYNGTSFTVNTSQNIATLSNLTTNGVLTTTGAAGTLVVDASGLDVANGGTGATSFAANSIIVSNAAGTALIATTSQLTTGSLLATSTATSTFTGSLIVGNSTTNPLALGGYTHPYVRIGTTSCPINPTFYNYFEICGNEDSTNGIQAYIGNSSAGTKAFTGWSLGNNRSDTNLTNFAGSYLNSDTYSDTTFGTAVAIPSLFSLENSMGPISIIAATTSIPSSYITVITGGAATANEAARWTGGGDYGIGTTTPKWRLTVASSTGPQVTLTDGSITDAPFNFRAGNNAFYLSTSSITTFATSTNPILSIINGGIAGLLGLGSSTPSAQFAINSTAGFWPFAIGSSTGNLFSVSPYGEITLSEQRAGTSTAAKIDWSTSGPTVLYQTGVSATTINIVNATTSQFAGSRKMVTVCNPGATAGAITWAAVEWSGNTAPTQTTTANQCDVYSFFITAATSTAAAPTWKVFGSGTTGFQ